jgi:hypothetical protein
MIFNIPAEFLWLATGFIIFMAAFLVADPE